MKLAGRKYVIALLITGTKNTTSSINNPKWNCSMHIKEWENKYQILSKELKKYRQNSSWNTGILCHNNPTWIWKINEAITLTMIRLRAKTGIQIGKQEVVRNTQRMWSMNCKILGKR